MFGISWFCFVLFLEREIKTWFCWNGWSQAMRENWSFKRMLWRGSSIVIFFSGAILFLLWESTEMVPFRVKVIYLFSPWKYDSFSSSDKVSFSSTHTFTLLICKLQNTSQHAAELCTIYSLYKMLQHIQHKPVMKDHVIHR